MEGLKGDTILKFGVDIWHIETNDVVVIIFREFEEDKWTFYLLIIQRNNKQTKFIESIPK